MSVPTLEIPLTFPNFNVAFADPRDIYDIGAPLNGTGVLSEMAEAYGYKLTTEPNEANLEGLVEVIGQTEKRLDTVLDVRARHDKDEDAVAMIRSWASRTGLLEPVSRSYIHPGIDLPNRRYLALMTDGVATSMERRARTLVSLYNRTGYAAPTLLVAGKRLMQVAENPEKVREGMTRVDYMRNHIQPHLARSGITTMIAGPETEVDDEVIEGAVAGLDRVGYRGPVVMASDAGAWPQNGGRLRRAITRADADNHLYVIAEREAAPETSAAVAKTHQAQASIPEQIALNHLELYRNIAHRAA